VAQAARFEAADFARTLRYGLPPPCGSAREDRAGEHSPSSLDDVVIDPDFIFPPVMTSLLIGINVAVYLLEVPCPASRSSA
jgi:hypothetical protein